MSLVFAAITPHPPILIPTIGQAAIKKMEKTKLAMEQLEKDLYITHPDIIIVISSHGGFFKDAFTIHSHTEYQTDLKMFGDLATKTKFNGENFLSARIREALKQEHIPATMVSEPSLDHGSSIPLIYLTPHLKKISVLPIGFCDLDWKTHVHFGSILKEKILETNKRIAVIASGDLSHALVTDAPAGYHPAGAEFDKKIQELLSTNNLSGMLQLDAEMVANAAECGFKTFLILMSILQGFHNTYRSYAYEAPFGVGHLTANFLL